MGRKKTRTHPGMSVYPDYDLGPAVGAIRTSELNRSIRRDAHVMALAAIQVAPRFTSEEWQVLAQVFANRDVPEEMAAPGPLMAELLGQALVRRGSPEDGAGDGATLVERVGQLSYHEAHAVLVAVRFYKDNVARLEKDAHWWELAVRWKVLREQT